MHRVQLYDGTLAWLVTRHKEVCEALSSSKLSNVCTLQIINTTRRQVLIGSQARFNRTGYPEIHSGGKKAYQKPTFVHMDGPGHMRQRYV